MGVLSPLGEPGCHDELGESRPKAMSSSRYQRFDRSSREVGWTGFGVYVGEALGTTSCVRVAGELDVATAGLMEDGLTLATDAPGTHLVVDAARLTFIDAAGLGVIVLANKRLAASGGEMVVRGASGIVRRVFELTGLTGLLDKGEERWDPRTTEGDRGAVARATADERLSVDDLFIEYFALGGTADWGHLAAYLAGDTDALDRHQRSILDLAVDERLLDTGRAGSADRLLSELSS